MMHDETEVDRLRRENANLRAQLDVYQIKVSFPPENMALERERLMKALNASRAHQTAVAAMLTALRSMCSHPNRSQLSCKDCGADWSD